MISIPFISSTLSHPSLVYFELLTCFFVLTLLSVWCHMYPHVFTCLHSVLHTLTHLQLPDFLVILSSFSHSASLTRLFSLSFLMFAFLLLLSQPPCEKQSQPLHDTEVKTPSYVQKGTTCISCSQ